MAAASHPLHPFHLQQTQLYAQQLGQLQHQQPNSAAANALTLQQQQQVVAQQQQMLHSNSQYHMLGMAQAQAANGHYPLQSGLTAQLTAMHQQLTQHSGQHGQHAQQQQNLGSSLSVHQQGVLQQGAAAHLVSSIGYPALGAAGGVSGGNPYQATQMGAQGFSGLGGMLAQSGAANNQAGAGGTSLGQLHLATQSSQASSNSIATTSATMGMNLGLSFGFGSTVPNDPNASPLHSSTSGPSSAAQALMAQLGSAGRPNPGSPFQMNFQGGAPSFSGENISGPPVSQAGGGSYHIATTNPQVPSSSAGGAYSAGGPFGGDPPTHLTRMPSYMSSAGPQSGAVAGAGLGLGGLSGMSLGGLAPGSHPQFSSGAGLGAQTIRQNLLAAQTVQQAAQRQREIAAASAAAGTKPNSGANPGVGNGGNGGNGPAPAQSQDSNRAGGSPARRTTGKDDEDDRGASGGGGTRGPVGSALAGNAFSNNGSGGATGIARTGIAPSGPDDEPERDSKKMLDIYIHDYLTKRKFTAAARAFSEEAGLGGAASPGHDVPEGFLYEWWTTFWDSNAARSRSIGSTTGGPASPPTHSTPSFLDSLSGRSAGGAVGLRVSAMPALNTQNASNADLHSATPTSAPPVTGQTKLSSVQGAQTGTIGNSPDINRDGGVQSSNSGADGSFEDLSPAQLQAILGALGLTGKDPTQLNYHERQMVLALQRHGSAAVAPTHPSASNFNGTDNGMGGSGQLQGGSFIQQSTIAQISAGAHKMFNIPQQQNALGGGLGGGQQQTNTATRQQQPIMAQNQNPQLEGSSQNVRSEALSGSQHGFTGIPSQNPSPTPPVNSAQQQALAIQQLQMQQQSQQVESPVHRQKFVNRQSSSGSLGQGSTPTGVGQLQHQYSQMTTQGMLADSVASASGEVNRLKQVYAHQLQAQHLQALHQQSTGLRDQATAHGMAMMNGSAFAQRPPSSQANVSGTGGLMVGGNGLTNSGQAQAQQEFHQTQLGGYNAGIATANGIIGANGMNVGAFAQNGTGNAMDPFHSYRLMLNRGQMQPGLANGIAGVGPAGVQAHFMGGDQRVMSGQPPFLDQRLLAMSNGVNGNIGLAGNPATQAQLAMIQSQLRHQQQQQLLRSSQSDLNSVGGTPQSPASPHYPSSSSPGANQAPFGGATTGAKRKRKATEHFSKKQSTTSTSGPATPQPTPDPPTPLTVPLESGGFHMDGSTDLHSHGFATQRMIDLKHDAEAYGEANQCGLQDSDIATPVNSASEFGSVMGGMMGNEDIDNDYGMEWLAGEAGVNPSIVLGGSGDWGSGMEDGLLPDSSHDVMTSQISGLSRKGDESASRKVHGTLLADLKSHNNKVATCALDASSRTLASGGHDRKVIIWDILKGSPSSVSKRFVLENHQQAVNTVRFSNFCSAVVGDTDTALSHVLNELPLMLATSSMDKTVRVYPITSAETCPEPIKTFLDHRASVTAVDFCPYVAVGNEGTPMDVEKYDSSLRINIFCGSLDAEGELKVWSPLTGKCEKSIKLPSKTAYSSNPLRFRPANRLSGTLTVSAQTTIAAAIASSLNLVDFAIPLHDKTSAPPLQVASNRKASSANLSASLLSATTDSEASILVYSTPHAKNIMSLDWSSDGQWLTTASDDILCLWEVGQSVIDGCKLVAQQPISNGKVSSCAFLQEQAPLLPGSSDASSPPRIVFGEFEKLYVWDPSTGMASSSGSPYGKFGGSGGGLSVSALTSQEKDLTSAISGLACVGTWLIEERDQGEGDTAEEQSSAGGRRTLVLASASSGKESNLKLWEVVG
ncbi:hypothetical protein M427DRAFT_147845 [Gonapodya prolifera JEL478]|uniref:LisH domain-containing protein n=1 Tax=Gonapodya prolifera (strain JEL478) TaxID=1344416 RepID=A0A139A3H6_GONPJ|nr:hypothetical protein M427DRAFT_147845 [Gonapodya prolifera JEL478]|eukprot:KXS11331.1 hypothetical protein M427DRAFT_147845 [Gonapodya prolifera JEL478]